ncbi:MAG: hypothetical protein GY927_03560 [bacterium]|nr:hypothetical protein [bacterium]
MNYTGTQLILAIVGGFAAILIVTYLMSTEDADITALEKKIEYGLKKHLMAYSDSNASTYDVRTTSCLISIDARRINNCNSPKQHKREEIIIHLPEIKKLQTYIGKGKRRKRIAFLALQFTNKASIAIQLTNLRTLQSGSSSPGGQPADPTASATKLKNFLSSHLLHMCSGSRSSHLSKSGITLHFKPQKENELNALFANINSYKNHCRKNN